MERKVEMVEPGVIMYVAGDIDACATPAGPSEGRMFADADGERGI